MNENHFWQHSWHIHSKHKENKCLVYQPWHFNLKLKNIFKVYVTNDTVEHSLYEIEKKYYYPNIECIVFIILIFSEKVVWDILLNTETILIGNEIFVK